MPYVYTDYIFKNVRPLRYADLLRLITHYVGFVVKKVIYTISFEYYYYDLRQGHYYVKFSFSATYFTSEFLYQSSPISCKYKSEYHFGTKFPSEYL